MRLRWDEDTASKLSLLAVPAGFIAGSAAGLTGVGILLVRVLIPQRHWWAVADGIGYGLFAIIFGGAGTAIAAMRTVDWVAYRTGVYRCGHCDRPVQRRGLCACQPPVEAEAAPTWRERVGRWLRANGPPAVRVAVALLPLAVVMVWLAARWRPIRSWPTDVAAIHAILCVTVHLPVEMSEWLPSDRIRAWRRRWLSPAYLLAGYGMAGLGLTILVW